MTISKINPGFRLQGRKPGVFLSLLTVLSAILLAFGGELPLVSAASDPDFANNYFRSTWERTDLPIAQTKTSRSWYWGPKPNTTALQEAYAETPGGKREVQYFDKARMEINNPAKNVVTNGLLVVELITGKRQDGDNTFVNAGAANVPVAGDPDNAWPTYASLGGVYLKARDMKPGQVVTSSWEPGGVVLQQKYKNDPATVIAVQQNGLGIPAAFWTFLGRKGPVSVSGSLQDETISDWLFSTGLPVTEAYWTRVKVGGQDKDVMFQAFERRVLTYTPSNPADYQVEMGNVGLHYMTWRYPKGVPSPYTDPLANIFLGDQPEWYEVTGDVLNVRTAPSTTAPYPPRTDTLPLLQRLVKGNRVQVLRSVQGEEIEKGNSTWFQFYEKPDLFVYSGYVRKMTLPAFPTPPHTYKGLWVSVNLTQQMLAVFYDNKLLYKTFIASGIPSDDPAKDHRTPTGVYKIDGSYRPKVQTMEGGTGDRASGGDYYKLDDIRNVSYFYQDYAIHGTYWHARFGTYPQSHGCVNATNYDAGLVYQLKAGTTVEVFRSDSAPLNSNG